MQRPSGGRAPGMFEEQQGGQVAGGQQMKSGTGASSCRASWATVKMAFTLREMGGH